VLEIGTGSGYQAAVLSRVARSVVSLERYRTLAEVARARLKRLNYENVEVLLGDGLHGDAMRAPYDRIIVTAAAESVPKELAAQLKEGGVMILPLGPHTGTQTLVRFRKRGEELVREDLIAVRFVPLLAGQAREL
jgi:protein-L-isoaspartate(D-aspartate) O-methyltransferase